MPPEHPTIAVDFDNVLHSYVHRWTGPIPEDPPVPGAQDFIDDLLGRGYKVVIFSHRAHTKEGEQGIRQWLVKYDFPRLPVTDKKPAALCYIDDRAFRFEGDFKQVIKFIESPAIEPWVTRD